MSVISLRSPPPPFPLTDTATIITSELNSKNHHTSPPSSLQDIRADYAVKMCSIHVYICREHFIIQYCKIKRCNAATEGRTDLLREEYVAFKDALRLPPQGNCPTAPKICHRVRVVWHGLFGARGTGCWERRGSLEYDPAGMKSTSAVVNFPIRGNGEDEA